MTTPTSKKEGRKRLFTKLLADKWLKDNKEFVKDYVEICNNIMAFKIMWGVNIGIILKDPDEPKGRGLGEGMKVEKLFQ